jgi:cation transporter-like permease
MFDESKSLYAKKISPFLQVGVVLAIIVIFNLFAIGFKSIDLFTDPGNPWLITTSFVLFYALVNSVLSIASDNQNRYWLHSIISYVILLVVGCLIAYLFSGLSIDEAGSYRWILLIFSISYTLFLAIVRTMKRIVKIAQKQDRALRGEE